MHRSGRREHDYGTDDRTDGPVSGRVDLSREVQRVGGRQIRIGRSHGQNDGIVALQSGRQRQ